MIEKVPSNSLTLGWQQEGGQLKSSMDQSKQTWTVSCRGASSPLEHCQGALKQSAKALTLL